MSRASKLTLAATSLFAASTVVFVHFQQKSERLVRFASLIFQMYTPPVEAKTKSADTAKAMHEGVVRDMEQQRVKRERQLDFDMQRALEEEYKQEQSVHSSVEPMDAKGQTQTTQR
jgi:protein PET117